MKKAKIKILGNSILAYVTFYDDQILTKLNEIEQGNFDFLDFANEHGKKSVFLGRGFCENGNLNIEICIDDLEVYSGQPYLFDVKDGPVDQIQQHFKDEYGDDEDYETSLIAKESDYITADQHYFADAGNYKYCSLETVECYTSAYNIIIDVDDDFTLTDLSVVLLDVDTGGNGSITQNLYAATGLEKQALGIKYKDKFFEFHGGEDEGGSNEIFWFECDEEKWVGSEAIQERIDELDSW